MDKKIKIQIRNRWTGTLIFEYEKVDNTIKQTVLEAARQKVNLRDADLRGANLCDADLRCANLRDANLRDADLRDANLRDADLRDADLRDADLRGANLCDADLRGADLRDADLCDADLRCADLRDANLRDANLRDADLRGANLRGCVLDYDDYKEGYEGLDELKDNVESNSNLKLTKLYENHDSHSSRWGLFWRNLIIIREWEVVEKNTVKVELSKEQKSLIKLFAKTHQANTLEYKLYTDGDLVYGGFAIDDGSDDYKLLDFPDTIKGLVGDKIYTLAELGIEL